MMFYAMVDSVSQLTDSLKDQARAIGFDFVGVAPAVTLEGFERLTTWLEKCYHGEMRYLQRRQAAYVHPQAVLERVRSLVMVALNYRNAEPPPIRSGQGRVSRYAWGNADYHRVMKEQLKNLGDWLHRQQPGIRTRGVVDTAPLLEREVARLAGIGWFGKNTMLINKYAGSFFFLGALLTDCELTPDSPHVSSHCGTCTRCLDECPTDAFPEPGVLDARRCLSYLTIELKSAVPFALRTEFHDWLFGCDICQDVCPWNRKAPKGHDTAFVPRADLYPAELLELLRLDDAEFLKRFSGSPLERPGRSGILRNACLLLGNTKDPQFVSPLTKALDDVSPLIRGAAAWALGAISSPAAIEALQSRWQEEPDQSVLVEIEQALASRREIRS